MSWNISEQLGMHFTSKFNCFLFKACGKLYFSKTHCTQAILPIRFQILKITFALIYTWIKFVLYQNYIFLKDLEGS